jgi:hypothetical protein
MWNLLLNAKVGKDFNKLLNLLIQTCFVDPNFFYAINDFQDVS